MKRQRNFDSLKRLVRFFKMMAGVFGTAAMTLWLIFGCPFPYSVYVLAGALVCFVVWNIWDETK